MEKIRIEYFIKEGFALSDDPQFKLEYDLSNPDSDEDEPKPALLFDSVNNAYCVTDGELMFIYFNADSPKKAVDWANKITNFEYN